MKTTIIEKTVQLSKKGMKELKKGILQLEHDKNKVVQSLRELDKTFKHEERMERIEKLSYLESIESELSEKKATLTSAKLLPSRRTKLQVAIGSVVDLIDKYGHLFRYKIVDSTEANPSDGRISTISPLGRMLIGHTVRDIIVLHTGKKTNYFQLLQII